MSNKLQIQTRIIAVMWGAQIPNYLDFEWHSKTQQPDHSKSRKIALILDFYVLVLLWSSQDYSWIYGPYYRLPDHSYRQWSLIRTSNCSNSIVYWPQMFGIRASHVHLTRCYDNEHPDIEVPDIEVRTLRSQWHWGPGDIEVPDHILTCPY